MKPVGRLKWAKVERRGRRDGGGEEEEEEGAAESKKKEDENLKVLVSENESLPKKGDF